MITENLSTLKIHKLTQAQYNRELEAGNIDENALYLTPDEASDLGIYATKEELDTKADSIHDHDSLYYKEYEIDEMLSYKADESHSHGISDVTNLQSSLDSKTSQLYVDEQVNAVKESLESHTDNSDIHVTSENKAQLDEAHSHATSDHAPSDAEKNTIVGIKRNGEDLTIDADRKVNITVPTTASDIGAASSTHDHNDQYDSKGSAGTVQDALDAHTSNSDIHFTATERTKLSGIEAGAQANTITGVKGDSESSYRTGNVNITKSNIGLGNVDNTSDTNKPVSTAQQAAIDGVLSEAKAYTDGKISGMATTTVVDNKISTHNSSASAHSDIRGLISDLATKVNNFLDVDDATTDQLSEVLELINNNKGTLDSLTSDKVNVSDIIDNLTTPSATKVLSAKQGVALKSLIDTLQAEVDSKIESVSLASGTNKGTLKLTVDGNSTDNIAVKGLGSAAYTASTDYAAASHGNHVPATETANNAKFLRNDNTWATVTPDNIGAAKSSHGTHVTWSTTSPKMNGTAAVGSETKVARGDHVHPTDTSRASQTAFDEHVADTTKHITSTERTNWGSAYTHSTSAHAPSNAQANVIESIKVNGTDQTISSKSVNITVPTKASDIGAAETTHGTHVSYSTTAPVMDGTASVGSASTVARSDHKHPTDTSRASQVDLDALEAVVDGKASKTHSHAISDVTDLQVELDTINSELDGSIKDLSVSGKVITYTKNDGTTGTITTQDTNTTYTNADLGQGYGTCSSGSSTSSAKIAALSGYMLKTGGIVSIRFTYAVPSNATLNINNTGAKNIYFRGSAITANVIKAGDIATFVYSSQYHLISIDRWQNDIDSKQATITGAATTITGSNLTASRALISNSSGKVDVSAVTSTELGYLDGVTSGIQAQIDSKANSDHAHNYAGSSEAGGAATSANKLNTNAGSATQPVYFSGGIPVACTNTLGKSVPSDAVFTDAKVTQTVRTTDGEFPILLRGTSAGTSTTTTGTTFGTKMTANPSTGAMTITSLKLGDATISYDTTEKAIVFNFK